MIGCRITVSSREAFVDFLNMYSASGLTIELRVIDGKRDQKFTEWKQSLIKANRNCILKF
jgi:hypothetical protein